ncbi:MAG: hypothetical protein ACR2QC_00930, partial [Gammaproteobacteria bacterium]
MRKPSTITPKEFRKAADSILSKRDMRKRLESQWSDKFGSYAEAWEGQMDGCGFYNRLGQKLQHKCRQQYAGVGAVYYKKRSPYTGSGCAAEFISLAFEHESDPGRSANAMHRLLTITAPLKVLATYIDGRSEVEYLENYAAQIRAVDRALPGFSEQQKHIAMFCLENKRDWLWKYHLFAD